jgi:hypothetical protein
MKTALFCMLTILAGISIAGAQGSLAACNQFTTPLTVVNRDGSVSNIVGSTGALLSQGAVIVSLWVGADGSPENTMRQVAIGTNAASSFPGAIGVFILGNPLTLSAPWDGRAPIQLVYRAWSISTGATNWESAVAANKAGKGYIGQSDYIRRFSLGALGQAPATFGPGLLQGIVLKQSPN